MIRISDLVENSFVSMDRLPCTTVVEAIDSDGIL